VNAPLAQFRVFLQFANYIHTIQRHFSLGILWGMAFVFKPSDALSNPSLECGMHGLIAGFKIASNTGEMQSISMETNDGQAAFSGIVDFRPGRRAPSISHFLDVLTPLGPQAGLAYLVLRRQPSTHRLPPQHL
jgi:hypothetical protein